MKNTYKKRVKEIDSSARIEKINQHFFVKVNKGFVSCAENEDDAWKYAIPRLLYPSEALR